MRVFQLNTFFGEKSTGRIALEIAKLVERDGGECKTGYGAGSPPEEYARFAYRIGGGAERKLCSQFRKLADAEGRGCYFGSRALLEEMERFRPDVVQLHNLHGCYLHLPSLFAYLQRKELPVVWTLHDCWPFTGHCAYFDYAGCDKWKEGCYSCPQQRSYPSCYGFDRSRQNYLWKKSMFTALPRLTLVAPCQWMKEPLAQSFLRDVPVRVIYNGVDLETFRPTPGNLRERYGLGEKKLILSVASEWDERKGLRYLTDVADRLGEAYKIVCIGLSPAQIAAMPENMLGLPATGGARELAQWYTAADCFANPSMEDNMPMVNLEALACGTPLAVFRTGGCPEAADDTCGQTVEQGDAEALCRAIRSLTATEKPVEACLRRAERFDSRTTFANYVALYKELLA